MKKIVILFSVIAVFILASCDNKNIFGKFHKAGSSSSTEVLLNDANAALEENNPAKAKEIADKILVNDPGNSEALYISAAAGLKEAGLDLASIITNVIASTSTLGTDLIPENINLANMASATANAVTQLKKIADGQADGTIPYDDIDVNLNLGILQVLNAATKIFDLNNDGLFGSDDDPNEPIRLTSDFEVEINTTALSGLQGNTTAQAQVKSVMILLVGGEATNTLVGGVNDEQRSESGCLDYLDVALKTINLGEDNMLNDLQINVDDLTGGTTTEANNTIFDIWSLLQ